MNDKQNIINNFLNEIIEKKPTFIETKNSFVRMCLYEALEIYSARARSLLEFDSNRHTDTYGQIWCQRKKLIKPISFKYPICKKHGYKLTGGCDSCNDPWCCGPYCKKCGYKYCEYAIHQGKYYHSGKVTIGLNIFYNKPNFKCKSFPKNY